jgi:hypothetical protein
MRHAVEDACNTSAVTKPGPLWNPSSEDQLRSAADNGVLVESHHLDLKRELGSGSAANRNLAKDIAAFTLDGGMILIGVDEDFTPPSLYPIDLQGLPERVEQIARMRIDEGVSVNSVPIQSATDPSRGYLVVHVPASPRAPHMVDGKYYGRGDKTNRILSHAEVLRLHERQVADRRDIVAAAHHTLREFVGDDPAHPIPTMVLIADPLGTTGDLLVPLVESPDWRQTVVDLVQAATVPENQQFSPNLPPPTGLVHRGDGVATTKGMHDGGRFTAEQPRAVELLLNESGALMLASRRPVDFVVDGGEPVVMEVVVIGHTDLFVRLTALVSERFGFAGSWRFGLVVGSTRGAVSYRLTSGPFYDRGQELTVDFYERATTASLAELTQKPHQVVNRLVSPLLRNLGSDHLWPWLFDADAGR